MFPLHHYEADSKWRGCSNEGHRLSLMYDVASKSYVHVNKRRFLNVAIAACTSTLQCSAPSKEPDSQQTTSASQRLQTTPPPPR